MIQKCKMVCKNCVFFNKGDCHFEPIPWSIELIADPETHWCGLGEWKHYSPSTKMMELYKWGEGREDA